ncbi:MAG: circularly permuted type 2 ATP-grasp protein [Bacteroidota bacterium]
MLPNPLKETLLGQYKEEKGRHDEMWEEDAPYPHWNDLLFRLETLGAGELTHRQNELQRLLRENGVTYTVYGERTGDIRPWKLDPIPFLIDPKTWSMLCEGLKQRAWILQELLRDIYGPQKIMRAGILPPELIFSDPTYLVPCIQTIPENAWELTLYGADISKGPDERIWIVGDRTQAPSGWGYALENRISMTRVLPELFESSHIHKITDFFDTFSRRLSNLAPSGKRSPLIVILTPGPYNETYFEHAYLAALEGFVLAQGEDLMVREAKVWLKTLGGLEQVDVIVRRVDSSYCDPLELYPGSQLGVPGLLEAVRQGNVRIANPIGSGILENPGIMAFFSNICKFYGGEDLKIPNIATWWCGHEKERAYTLEHLDEILIRHIDTRRKVHTYPGWLLSREEKESLAREIQASPFQFVGQEQPLLSTAPSFQDQVLCARRTILRSLAISTGDSYDLLPGGLTRSASSQGEFQVSNQAGGISKDTWVLSASQTAPVEIPSDEVFRPEIKGLANLPSKTAENLFWVGRYTLRVIRTARLIQSVLRFQAESKNFEQLQDSKALEVLLKSLTHFTMTYPGFVEQEALIKAPEQELHDILVNKNRVGTLAFSIDRWIQSIKTVRDRWSYNTFIILDNIESQWKEMRDTSAKNFRRLRSGLDLLINGVGAFHGLNSDNIAGEDGRVLYDLGRHMEHAMLATHLIRSTLVGKREQMVEESLMKVVLRNTESLEAFRYRYRSHMQLPAVLNLLLLDQHYPRSLAFSLQNILDMLNSLPSPETRLNLAPEQKMVLEGATSLQLTDIIQLASTEEGFYIRNELDQLLGLVSKNLASTADLVIQKYFSHTQPGVSTHSPD